MAGSQNDSETEYVLKKGSEVPVDACKGWLDPCEYCDKRFCDWIPVDEDIYEKIPEKPGFFIIALKNKNTTEVVSILLHPSNIQKVAVAELDIIKEQISNKKSKYTKSTILARWMVLKKLEDKESIILCAHWKNNGILPKFLTAWPGKNLLEGSSVVQFSKQTEKWCYPQKNPVWRKSKPPSTKTLEEVEKCNLHSCEVCDSYFTPWKSLSDVVENNLAPDEKGFVMLSVVYGKKREVILIPSDKKAIVLPIKATIRSYERNEKMYLRDSKFENKNPNLEVRWMLVKNVDSDNSCFLYAHWFNADNWPKYNDTYLPIPGENSLNKNKHFVFRTNNKKWFYEIEALKQTKLGKSKNKRRIFEELADQEYDEMAET